MPGTSSSVCELDSFFGVSETSITQGFQLTIKLGEQAQKRKHVCVQPALLRRCGLDVSDLFSTISSWPSPNFSPGSLCRACSWLGTGTQLNFLGAHIPLQGSPECSGLLVTGLHEANYQNFQGEGVQVSLHGEEKRLRECWCLYKPLLCSSASGKSF